MKKKITLVVLLLFICLSAGYAQTDTITEAQVPYFQGFESWIDAGLSRPDSSFTTYPGTGDMSWRREDQGTYANWDYPDDAGWYTPYGPDAVATQGSHAARFHSSDDYDTSGIQGDLDLHIDLSTPGTKLISFDLNNADQDDNASLIVLIATDSVSFTQIGQYYPTPNWEHEQIATTVTSPHAIIRFQGNTGGLVYGDMGIDSLYISVLPSCSGTPVAGALSASQTSGCASYSSLMQLAVDNSIGGLTYQWQSSADGTTYGNVLGATNTVYTANVTAEIWYRVAITCTGSGITVNSGAQHLHYVTSIVPAYATLPYFQGFDSWIGTCYNYDRPDSSWYNNPSYGDASWRNYGQGADAGWDYPSEGSYYPGGYPGSIGISSSARFHSSENYSEAGDLDLYVDMSTPGTKHISFYYNNPDDDSTSFLTVIASPDSGYTWDTLGQYGYQGPNAGWEHKLISTTITSHTILRFDGYDGGSSNDMGFDSLYITVLTACNGTPTAGTITTSQAVGCGEYTPTLSLPVNNSVSGLAYQWFTSTNGTSYSLVSGATDASYQADVTANVYYKVVVTCTISAHTDTSAPIELILTTPVAHSAVLPYFQGFENWMGTCSMYDRPDSNWILNPTYGDLSWRRDDQGADAGWDYLMYAGYSPTSTEGAHSACFHSIASIFNGGGTGSMDLYADLSTPGTKTITFDYINTDAASASTLTVLISTDSVNFTQLAQYGFTTGNWGADTITTEVASHAIIRFQANATESFGDMGMDSLNISAPPCDPLSGVAISGINDNSATVNWNSGGTGNYEVVIDQSTTDPTGSGTVVTAATYTASPLLSGTSYYAHVRDSCGPGSLSSWITVPFVTTGTQGPCSAVTNLAATNITTNSATISWTAIGGVAGYQVTVDQSATAPSVSGTYDANATSNATGLQGGTTYYAHVRDTCSPGSVSDWVTISFTTTEPFCDTISGLHASGITASGATIAWNAIAGATGYEVVVGTSSATPASGQVVTSPVYNATGFTASTIYYVFVRDSCDTHNFSAWDTLSFITPYNQGITTVNGNNPFTIDAYPNPAKDVITIRAYGIKGNDPKVSLTDVTGRVISNVDMVTDRVDFNMGNLAAGIYLVRYEDGVHTSVIKINKQ